MRVRWGLAVLLTLAAVAGGVALVLPGLRAPKPGNPLDPAEHFTGAGLAMARAVDRNDWDTLDRLVYEGGIDPDTVFDHQGRPLLLWPLLTRNPMGLHLLLNVGATADVRLQTTGVPVGTAAESALVQAAGMADSRYLIELLQRGGDPNGRNAAGEPLLYVAFRSGHWDNVQLLVMAGANMDTTRSGEGGYDTVLSWYAKLGRFDRLYWLLDHGGDPTLRMHDLHDSRLAGTAESYAGRTPIVEDVFYTQVPAQMKDWQQACQAWLLLHNITRPPAPPSTRMRERVRAQDEESNAVQF
ncbi:MAG: ankyrin repeat domain-containing protein [Pseudoxanthomonas sp.]